MKRQTFNRLLLIFLTTFSCAVTAAPKNGKGLKITFAKNESEKRVDVLVEGKLFTSYIWPDNVMKPVLYPVTTAKGTEITRGYPMKPRAGERVDHPHHIGIWFNYGDVNGFDFWNNSTAIPAEKKGEYGTVKHVSVDQLLEGLGSAVLVTTSSWVDPSGKEFLREKTEFHFIAKGDVRIIDRVATLTATHGKVMMKDNKEGMIAMRVARQLELPSKDEVIMTDAQGNPTTVKKMSNEGVTGSYRSSEGIKDDAVWGTRGKWMDLNGTIGDEKIAIVMCDHPKNQSYPTYWHARGYGLYAANPLGWSIFTKGKQTLNYSIDEGKSSLFRYRIVINSGSDLTDAQINTYADEFAKMY